MNRIGKLKKSFFHPLIHGTLLLTVTGFVSRILGFFYRIFLSNTIGAHGMGIYQLIFPVYGLCHAVCTASIQTSISRYTAAELSLGSKKGAKHVLHAGLFLSCALSGFLALLIYQCSVPIAVYFLQEPSCAPLLRVMALSLPLGAIHSSINGYYYGMQKAAVPAFSQLVEQIIRVGSVYAITTVALTNHLTITPILAVYGLLLGECASVLYCVLALNLHGADHSESTSKQTPSSGFRKQMKNIVLLSVPLSINRLMIHLLQSMEAVSIPTALRQYGLNNLNALEIYGILTGMAMPYNVNIKIKLYFQYRKTLLISIVKAGHNPFSHRIMTGFFMKSIPTFYLATAQLLE